MPNPLSPDTDLLATGRPTTVFPIRTISADLAVEARAWLNGLAEQGKAENTLAAYGRDIWHVLNEIAVVTDRRIALADLAQVGQSEIDGLVAAWRDAGATVSTVLRRLSALRSFARYLTDAGLADGKGILAAVLPQAEKAIGTGCGDQAFQRLVDLQPGRGSNPTWIDLRDLALVLLQSETGMTTGEIVSLDLSDRPTLERPIISILKTHLAPRDLAVSETAIQAIDRYLAARPGGQHPDNPLFMGARGDRLKPRLVQLSLQDIRGTAGIRGPLTVRAVRHALAERMKAEGQSVEAVAHQLGLSVSAAGRYFGDAERRKSARVRRPKG